MVPLSATTTAQFPQESFGREELEPFLLALSLPAPKNMFYVDRHLWCPRLLIERMRSRSFVRTTKKSAGAAKKVWRVGKVKESEQHYIDFGLRWKSKGPSFYGARALPGKTHTASTTSGGVSAAYTAYNVTSTFDASSTPSGDTSFHEHCRSWSVQEEAPTPADPTDEITVQRRFSHFVFLHAALSRYCLASPSRHYQRNNMLDDLATLSSRHAVQICSGI